VLDLNEAIRLDQTCALAYFNRALCFQQLKEYNNALKDFSVILMLGDYLEFKTYVNRALLYFNLKDYTNALADFRFAFKHEPTDCHILHMIGVCLHRLGNYDNAVERLTEAFDLDKSFLDALISRGNVYIDYGNELGFMKAMRDYQHVLLKQSANMDAHINLGYLYQIMSRFKLAWEQFSEAIEINPSIYLCFEIRVCFCAGLTKYNDDFFLSPYQDHPSLYEGRSVVCLQMSNTDAALKDINKALSIKKTAELFVNRGVIYQVSFRFISSSAGIYMVYDDMIKSTFSSNKHFMNFHQKLLMKNYEKNLYG
jgi:tetratricopeptide (TPR) repeat protein